MAKEDLIPLNKRTKEEQKAIAKKGGIKSGIARARKKTLKQELLMLLSQGKTQENITLSLIEQALNGNVKAFETIRDTIGEKPIDKVEVSNIESSTIEEIEDLVKNEE